MAMPMPLNSQALLHYYCTANFLTFSVPPYSARNLFVSTATQDGDALRNILLISCWHRTWAVRNLKDFEATFNAHMVESLQKTRGWIEEDRSRDALLKAVQAIATHCVVRASLGDTSEAETHQRGLIALAEHLGLGCTQEFDLQEELMHRYTMLAIMIVQSTQQIIKHGALGKWSPTAVKDPREKPGGSERVHWPVLLMPFFFVAPMKARPQPIDVRGVLDVNAGVTAYVEMHLLSGSPDSGTFWRDGLTVERLMGILDAHMTSMTTEWNGKSKAASARPLLLDHWSPIMAASSLYFGIILALWDLGTVKRLRPAPYLARAVRHDLLQSHGEIARWDADHQRLWLWKAFVAALSLGLEEPDGRTVEVRGMEKQMRDFIRHWSIVTGITTWSSARKALEWISWPKTLHLEAEAFAIWAEALY